MKTIRSALVATATCVALAGCSAEPTAATVGEVDASFSGFGYGSGNRAGTDTTTAPTAEAAGAESPSSGMGYGSGN